MFIYYFPFSSRKVSRTESRMESRTGSKTGSTLPSRPEHTCGRKEISARAETKFRTDAPGFPSGRGKNRKRTINENTNHGDTEAVNGILQDDRGHSVKFSVPPWFEIYIFKKISSFLPFPSNGSVHRSVSRRPSTDDMMWQIIFK